MRFLVLLVLLSTGWLSAQTIVPNHKFDSLRNTITSWVNTDVHPSVSIGVFHRGKTVWLEAFGWKNVAQKEAATVETIYPLASVTKSFTATAVMMLVEQGKIKLDDPIDKYFSDKVIQAAFPIARKVTVRDLLHHTSGLDMYYRNVYHDEVSVGTEVVSAVNQFSHLIHPPGSRFAYANVGYAILGELVEKVSGLTYGQFLQQEICGPLGMENTFVRVNNAHVEQYAQLRGTNGDALPYVYTDTKGAGDIYSTAADLLEYGKMHMLRGKSQLLNPHSLGAMRSVTDTSIIRPDPCQPYGLGWFFAQGDKGEPVFWHEGGFDGAGSIIKVFPEEELVIAVIGNTTFNKARSSEIATSITELLLPDFTLASCPAPALSPGVDTTHFNGDWSGSILAGQDTIPLTLSFMENGEIRTTFTDSQTRFFFIDNQAFPKKAFVHYPNSNKNHLTGWLLEGIITTSDWVNTHHILQLDLYYENGEITGSARAFESNQDREGLATAFFVQFERVNAEVR